MRVGKESAVIHAVGGQMESQKNGTIQLPDECALKVAFLSQIHSRFPQCLQ